MWRCFFRYVLIQFGVFVLTTHLLMIGRATTLQRSAIAGVTYEKVGVYTKVVMVDYFHPGIVCRKSDSVCVQPRPSRGMDRKYPTGETETRSSSGDGNAPLRIKHSLDLGESPYMVPAGHQLQIHRRNPMSWPVGCRMREGSSLKEAHTYLSLQHGGRCSASFIYRGKLRERQYLF